MRILVNERLSEHRVKTPEGYLICMDAILARTGKQTYRHNEIFKDSDDDSEIEIDRPEAEVFSDKTLASFENKPITDEHPDEDVTVLNYKDHAIGFVRDIRRAKDGDQDVMIGNLVITDKDAIEEIESGERTELSCGYDCEIADDNGHYIQKNIRGNHVALCEHGRAGNARIIDSNNVCDANKRVESIIEYFNAWGYPGRKELQEAVDFYKMSKDDVNKVFGPRIGRTYGKEDLNALKTYDSVDDAQMHTYEICYIDYSEVCIAIVAKNEQDAIRKFRRDYGYYTIVHVKQKDSINDAAKFYVVICENNDVYIAESIDRAKRLANTHDGDVYEVDGNIEFYRQTLKKFGQRAAFDEWWNDRRKGKARLVDAKQHYYVEFEVNGKKKWTNIVAESEEQVERIMANHGYKATLISANQFAKKDSVQDARYEYYIIESAGGQHLSEGGRLTSNPNDYREVEDRDEAERLARFYSQKLGVQLYVKKDFYIDSVDDTYSEGQSFTNNNGAKIKVTGRSKEGKIQFEIRFNGKVDARQATEEGFKKLIKLNGYTQDSVDDAIVEPDTNDLKGLEKIFEQNGFKVESLKKNLFSGYHYQIRSTQAYPKEKFKETVIQIARKIDAYKNKTDCSITWNFGHMDDGTITAGVDVHDKYVKDSMKEFIVKHNDRKFKVKAASPKDAVKRVARLK